MFPPYSSQSYPSPQVNSNGVPGPAAPQVMRNPGMQVQPQMALFNPQGSRTPNTYPSVPRFPFQGLQNPNNPINNVIPQMPAPFFAHNNVLNQTQFFPPNVNAGLSNSQWNFPNNNLIQTVNQLLQMQMQMQMQLQVPNFAQACPSGLPFSGNNQASQNVGILNHVFSGNAQFLPGNGATQQPMSLNLLEQPQQGNVSAMVQPQQGNVSAMVQPQQGNVSAMVQPHPNQSRLNPSDASKSQGGSVHAARFHTKGQWKGSFNNNYKRNQGHDAPHKGFWNATGQSSQNAKQRFNNQNDSLIKGHIKDVTENSFKRQNQIEKRPPPRLLYTEQEVQQWREERRKNYPSKVNTEKKSQKLAETEDNDNAIKLRRQQLKEILAKQAELGCEIAEIPSSYLSDLEQPGHERADNRRPFNRKEKFQYRFNRRGQSHQKSRFSKKQRTDNLNPSNTQERSIKREPTLLQKLLGADIKRDKLHLLQVFRFMVMNSFFVECPEKPLKFPSVIVKESGEENGAVEQESPIEEALNAVNDEQCHGVADLGIPKENIGNIEKDEHREEGEID